MQISQAGRMIRWRGVRVPIQSVMLGEQPDEDQRSWPTWLSKAEEICGGPQPRPSTPDGQPGCDSNSTEYRTGGRPCKSLRVSICMTAASMASASRLCFYRQACRLRRVCCPFNVHSLVSGEYPRLVPPEVRNF